MLELRHAQHAACENKARCSAIGVSQFVRKSLQPPSSVRNNLRFIRASASKRGGDIAELPLLHPASVLTGWTEGRTSTVLHCYSSRIPCFACSTGLWFYSSPPSLVTASQHGKLQPIISDSRGLFRTSAPRQSPAESPRIAILDCRLSRPRASRSQSATVPCQPQKRHCRCSHGRDDIYPCLPFIPSSLCSPTTTAPGSATRRPDCRLPPTLHCTCQGGSRGSA